MSATRKFTTAQLLRFPMIFGSIFVGYWVMYKYRSLYFGSDITEARQKSEEDRPQKEQVLNTMREEANTAWLNKQKRI